jgi:hypothetical protein
MVTLEEFKEYIHDDSPIAKLCFEAAKQKAKTAGVPEFKNNAQYDMFILALGGYWYDNRSLMDIGGDNTAVQNMINAFVLELRTTEEEENVTS